MYPQARWQKVWFLPVVFPEAVSELFLVAPRVAVLYPRVESTEWSASLLPAVEWDRLGQCLPLTRPAPNLRCFQSCFQMGLVQMGLSTS